MDIKIQLAETLNITVYYIYTYISFTDIGTRLFLPLTCAHTVITALYCASVDSSDVHP